MPSADPNPVQSSPGTGQVRARRLLFWWRAGLVVFTVVVAVLALRGWWPRWVEKYRWRERRARVQAQSQQLQWLRRIGAQRRPVSPEKIAQGWRWLTVALIVGAGVVGGLGYAVLRLLSAPEPEAHQLAQSDSPQAKSAQIP